ncbi:hypothetical protein JTS98_09905 [Clostridium botulinum]|nr:hypothetical protein [Clostridium botulinum]
MILLSIDGERIQLLTLKDYFLYKNINANNYWSATYEPCKSEGEHYKVKFYSDKIIFAREDGNITTEAHVTVSQEEDAEIRSINLKIIVTMTK